MEMTRKDKMFAGLKKDYLERKIFLKRQLILITEKEIEAIERDLQGNKYQREGLGNLEAKICKTLQN